MKPKGLYCFTEPKRETLVAGTYPGGDAPCVHGALQGLNGAESRRGRVRVGNLKQSHPQPPTSQTTALFFTAPHCFPPSPEPRWGGWGRRGGRISAEDQWGKGTWGALRCPWGEKGCV